MKGYNEVNDNAVSDIFTISAFILFMFLACSLGGCSLDRGWRFEIGVSPVSKLDNRAGLEETKEYNNKKNDKY